MNSKLDYEEMANRLWVMKSGSFYTELGIHKAWISETGVITVNGFKVGECRGLYTLLKDTYIENILKDSGAYKDD